jgi:hypothetical protein
MFIGLCARPAIDRQQHAGDERDFSVQTHAQGLSGDCSAGG